MPLYDFVWTQHSIHSTWLFTGPINPLFKQVFSTFTSFFQPSLPYSVLPSIWPVIHSIIHPSLFNLLCNFFSIFLYGFHIVEVCSLKTFCTCEIVWPGNHLNGVKGLQQSFPSYITAPPVRVFCTQAWKRGLDQIQNQNCSDHEKDSSKTIAVYVISYSQYKIRNVLNQ